ncbi:hypothetical protein J8I87_00560 [Paraburkholderia sp. LEh10]|jgi:hypothetical protein|uniref:hypothetical protein n=1 Tax=Paraburkholderia sp. LEh10 TaxID=2821353 RepID=UPI001AEA7733|nr:hypothetical protein [Paraburkholderia sp. LEh10]MBP0588239.1 hypothetical protein [Paraburkholderia sp. LEh10]
MLKSLAVAVLLACAAQAGAQQSDGKQQSESDGTSVQSGTAGKSMTSQAEQGSKGPASGTLMDKRAKALSPNEASGGKTGKISQ